MKTLCFGILHKVESIFHVLYVLGLNLLNSNEILTIEKVVETMTDKNMNDCQNRVRYFRSLEERLQPISHKKKNVENLEEAALLIIETLLIETYFSTATLTIDRSDSTAKLSKAKRKQ